MSDVSPLRFRVKEGIATITFNRTERRNAIDRATLDAIGRMFEAIDNDRDDVRVAVITGADGHFTAGIDIAENCEPADFMDFVERELISLYDRAMRLRVPLIAAIEGTAFATGSELTYCCDVAYAGRSASFCLADVRLGIPNASLRWHASEQLNRKRVAELAYTGRVFDAQTAYELGLLTRVVDDGTALETALETAREIADGPPLAVELTRRALRAADGNDWPAFLELARPALRSADFAEGLRAFSERRPPRFTGA